MKTFIKINAVAREITMTKAVEKKASCIGTEEYNQLLQVTKDFPNFTVKIMSQKKKNNSNKGLTLELMEKLVGVMTNNNQAAINGFIKLKEDYKGTDFHFSKPKAYFLSKYPNWREWLSEAKAEQVKADKAKIVQEEVKTEIETPQETSVERKGILHKIGVL